MKVKKPKLYKSDIAALKKAVQYGRVLGTQSRLKSHKDIPVANANRLTCAGFLTMPIADWWHVCEPTDVGRQVALHGLAVLSTALEERAAQWVIS